MYFSLLFLFEFLLLLLLLLPILWENKLFIIKRKKILSKNITVMYVSSRVQRYIIIIFHSFFLSLLFIRVIRDKLFSIFSYFFCIYSLVTSMNLIKEKKIKVITFDIQVRFLVFNSSDVLVYIKYILYYL